MSSFFELKSFLKHCIKANGRGGHGVHSPLVYELVTQVLHKEKQLYAFDKIEAQRNRLLNDDRIITVEDFGAGSRFGKSSHRKIQDIAKSALQPKHSAQALAKMVHHYRPTTILELGTSLGITTAYLASSNPSAQVLTIEGSKEIGVLAKNVWEELSIKNIQLLIGNIDDVLKQELERIQKIDFALLDGNHRYEPTMRYFNQILPFCHSDSILILDDIHWSSEMNRVWNEIIEHQQITASIDFFHFGILFFKSGRVKEHFVLHFP